MRLKRCFVGILVLIVTSFSLLGCKSEDKYSASWMQKNVDLSLDNKMVLIEDDTSEMIKLDASGMFFMEYGSSGSDWAFGYNIGGYKLEYYCVDGEQVGILNYADELERYNITGSMDDSRIIKDVNVVKDLFTIDYDNSKVIIHDDSDDGLAVVSLNTKEKVTVLFLDKETNECRRLEVCLLNDNGEVSELFLAAPTPVTKISLPDDIGDIEKVSDISADEFSSFCSRFVFSSLANASMNLELDGSETAEDNAAD